MRLNSREDGSALPRIHVPKTSEIVADRIRADIVRGKLTEGDSLPPEGQLMETLGISRPTLREAFRILEAEGLISVVRGSRTGAKVHKPSVDLVSRYAGYVLESQATTIADLYQARLAIEPTVVRWLATEKGQTPGMAEVHRVLDELRALLVAEKPNEFVDKIAYFHQALVEAAGNKTMGFMNRMLLNLMRVHQNSYKILYPQALPDELKNLRLGLRSYEKLLNLIEAGDVEEAVAHWRLHMRKANETWAGGSEGKKIVDSLAAS